MLHMIGTDYSLAPVSVRSVFACTKAESVSLMETIRRELQAEGVLILNTCNRFELWISVSEQKNGGEARLTDRLFRVLCKDKRVAPKDYRGFFVNRSQEEAVKHLFWLTCGLKSAILAEDQILTQVKDALAFSRENGFADSSLEVLFRMAVTAAKKVKTEVKFSRADSSAIEQAVSLLKQRGFGLKGKNCLVIGNGEYGRLAAVTLREQGADVMMTVRQYHHGLVHVPEGCQRVDYESRYEYLAYVDLAVSATTSPHCTIHREELLACRIDHPLVLIDLAVPRDIEPSIAMEDGFTLFDIDDFYTKDSSLNRDAWYQADEILNRAMQDFWTWENNRFLVKKIKKVQGLAVEDLDLRLHKVIGKMEIPEAEKKKLVEEINLAAGKTIGKLIFDLQDNISGDLFEEAVSGMEKIYEE